MLVATSEQTLALRENRLSRLQRRFDALPVDEAVADSYGQLSADAARRVRTRARTMDLLIAATAHAHGAQLCTRNLDDFSGLEEYLTVVAV